MKKALITIAMMAASAAFAAGIPQEWAVDVARVKPHQIQAYHGDTMELKATYWLNGVPFDVSGESFRLYWQTNAMEEIYWSADATAASNTVSATFANTMDPGAPIVYGFLGSTGGNYRASFAIRFSPGPGAVPNALPLPAPVIDFDKVEVLNPPWQTPDYSPSNAELVATIEAVSPPTDLSPATNYTDRVAGALSTSLAVAAQSATNYTDSVASTLRDYEALSNKPQINGVTLLGSQTLAELGILGNTGIQTLDGTLTVQNTEPDGNERLRAGDFGFDHNGTIHLHYGNQEYFVEVRGISGVLALLSDIYAAVQQIAPNFTAKAYVLNELCSYNGVVYRCKSGYIATASSAKPPSDATHWEAKKVSDLFLPITGGTITGILRALDLRSYIRYIDTGGTVYGARFVLAGATGEHYIQFAFQNDKYGIFVKNGPNDVGTFYAFSDFAPLASPAFTGTPTAPTPTAGDNSTKVATTAFVKTAVDSISVTPLSGNTYDFSTMQGVFDALKAAIEALGGTVTNAPASSQGE